MAGRSYNSWLKRKLGLKDKTCGLTVGPASDLFGFIERPLPLADTIQRNAFYSPYAPVRMLAGAGYSAAKSMATQNPAQYVPGQTRKTLDGYGAGVGAIDFGEIQGLSQQSQAVGIYTPSTAISALSQKSGGA